MHNRKAIKNYKTVSGKILDVWQPSLAATNVYLRILVDDLNRFFVINVGNEISQSDFNKIRSHENEKVILRMKKSHKHNNNKLFELITDSNLQKNVYDDNKNLIIFDPKSLLKVN